MLPSNAPVQCSVRRGAALPALLSCALLFTACEPPPAFPGADKRQNVHSGRIEGQVVMTGTTRGNAVVLLYDAARPPPPLGTGRPLAFTVVGREALFGAATATDTGPFTAPYAFSLVPRGRYLLRGFIDANADFVPWYGVTADVNAGDVGGGAVDVVTRALRVVEVGGDELTPAPALDVPVSFSDAARVPVDRPVFSFSVPATTPSATTPLVLELAATPIDDGVVHQSRPAFLVRLVDDDGDGVPDDANGDGVPDLWPRVVVRKLAGEDPTVDENDLDKNGVLDASGADYEHVDPATKAVLAADGKPDAVVLAAGFDVSALLPQLFDANGKVKATPTPVSKLTLVVKWQALDASTLPRPGVLSSVPKGEYAVTVIQSTGQTWRVPNELDPAWAAANAGRSLPTLASQATRLRQP